jgi:hypothetical protein
MMKSADSNIPGGMKPCVPVKFAERSPPFKELVIVNIPDKSLIYELNDITESL